MLGFLNPPNSPLLSITEGSFALVKVYPPLDPARQGNGTCGICGPDGGRLSEGIIVGHGDRFVQGPKWDKRQDRAELFLAHDRQAGVRIENPNRTLEESFLLKCCIGHLPQFLHVPPCGPRLCDHISPDLQLFGIVHWAHCSFGGITVAHLF